MSFKSGFIAIIGRPNAGKSTLINALVNTKVAIVSDKPQTTRNAIRGIRSTESEQLVFIDTPGIHKPQHELGKVMNKESYTSMSGADLIYYIVDATQKFGSGDQFVLDLMKNYDVPVFLLLNKVDKLSKDKVFARIEEWRHRRDFSEVFPISALNERNLKPLLETTSSYLEEGIAYYPVEQSSDHPIEFILAEIIREKVLKLTAEEVPHSIAVVIDTMRSEKNMIHIAASIYVERDSQKGILIGKQGAMLKQIGQAARGEMELILQQSIYLELYVRVEKKWRDRIQSLTRFGYQNSDDDE